MVKAIVNIGTGGSNPPPLQPDGCIQKRKSCARGIPRGTVRNSRRIISEIFRDDSKEDSGRSMENDSSRGGPTEDRTCGKGSTGLHNRKRRKEDSSFAVPETSFSESRKSPLLSGIPEGPVPVSGVGSPGALP